MPCFNYLVHVIVQVFLLFLSIEKALPKVTRPFHVFGAGWLCIIAESILWAGYIALHVASVHGISKKNLHFFVVSRVVLLLFGIWWSLWWRLDVG